MSQIGAASKRRFKRGFVIMPSMPPIPGVTGPECSELELLAGDMLSEEDVEAMWDIEYVDEAGVCNCDCESSDRSED